MRDESQTQNTTETTSDGDGHLYEVDIKYLASPEEVHTFVDLLEAEGYGVVTDLSAGKLRIKEGDGE